MKLDYIEWSSNTMSGKKIVIIIAVLLVIMVWFMNYSFRKIQTVELKVVVKENEKINAHIGEIIDELEHIKEIDFIGEVTVSDMPILIIDHVGKQAVLYSHTKTVVDYMDLDRTIINSNSYIAYVNKSVTLIVNSDEILGDTVERIVVLVYEHLMLDTSVLKPSEIEYFQILEENVVERYDRNEMLELMKHSYFGNNDLEAFGFYYNEWVELTGEKHLTVANYDYHEGFKAYLLTKVKEVRDADFNLEHYINGKTNSYGIYDKEETYAMIGLMWFLLAEREGIDPLKKDDMRVDRYKRLLKGTPYKSINKTNSYNQYNSSYTKNQTDINHVVEAIKVSTKGLEPISLDIISEAYKRTIKIDNNHYIYTDYVARLSNLTLIEKDYILVRIEPYRIRYYIEN